MQKIHGNSEQGDISLAQGRRWVHRAGFLERVAWALSCGLKAGLVQTGEMEGEMLSLGGGKGRGAPLNQPCEGSNSKGRRVGRHSGVMSGVTARPPRALPPAGVRLGMVGLPWGHLPSPGQ